MGGGPAGVAERREAVEKGAEEVIFWGTKGLLKSDEDGRALVNAVSERADAMIAMWICGRKLQEILEFKGIRCGN